MDEIELRAQLEMHHPVSYGWALNCCSHNNTEAKDVLQQAYLKILQGRARYKGHSSFKTWLFSVIRYTAADERRRSWLRFLGLKKYADKHVNGSENEEHADSSDKDEVSTAFRKLFAALPTRQKEVLHLVFYQDMTLQEASSVMGVSLGSARTHYERGKQNLRNMMATVKVIYED
ncbi:MAG: RNA polymerase sigma factor [Victivallales bacterium]|jgi:RNA polymerase sigma-70 factor (ECF subfamily)